MTFQSGLRIGAMTDVGRVRSANQDALLVIGDLAAVADGMGGHAAGEVASSLALHALREARITDEDALRDAIAAANDRVFSESVDRPSLHGMGTTLTVFVRMMLNDLEQVVIANVGDSRAYRFSDDQLLRLTRDHSYVADLVAAGELSETKARSHPKRNILTRAIGVEPNVGVDSWVLPLTIGDRFLLCSDGLINEVDEPLIAGTLSEVRDPQEAAEILVHLANSNGGRDNITVIVVDITDSDADQPSSLLLGAPVDQLPDNLDDTLDADVMAAFGDFDEPPARNGTFAAAIADVESPTGHFRSNIASTAKSLDTSTDPDSAPEPGGWLDDFEPDIHNTIASDDEAVEPLVDTATRDALPQGGWIVEPPLAVVRPRRLTLRVLVFVGLLAAVVYGAFYVVERAGRAGFTVKAQGDAIVLFEGPADGVLWVEPKQISTYSVSLSQIPLTVRDDARNGKHFGTRAEADVAVQRWSELGARDGVGGPSSTLVAVPTTISATTTSTTPPAPASSLTPADGAVSTTPSP
jgi:PPM family protein phosphatase